MRKAIIIGTASVFLLALSCKNAISPDTGLDYTPDTPRRCISALEYSLNAREAGLYHAALSPSFVFYFDDDDVGTYVNDFIIPESWGYEEECRAISNMLRPYGEGGAYDVVVYANTENVGDPPENADVYAASDVHISIDVQCNPTWAINNYVDSNDFEFLRITGSDDSYWLITEWRNINEVPEYGDTIGFIKAYFYSLEPLE
jgi:hypothetical protein